MIFVTVGHQMPFDRLLRVVDQWAALHPDQAVRGQTGESAYAPEHMNCQRMLSRDEYADCLDRCDAVVAHAGTGTIIDCLLQNKPLLVLPRLSELGETRNDHQIGTARHFAEQGQILAAYSEDELLQKLDELKQFRPARDIGTSASPELLARLQAFLSAADAGSG